MNRFATVIFAILEVALRSLRNAYTFVSSSRQISPKLIGLHKMAKPRARPVIAVALSIVLIACFTSLVTTVHASPADPGHAASSISEGTFESGNYVFPNNLTVTQFLIVNTDTLYVDSILGRVGIGTTSPKQTLDVVGSVNATGNLLFYGEIMPDGSTCGDNEILKRTGANTWGCAVDENSGGNVTGDGSASTIPKWTGQYTLGNSSIKDNGNVTINNSLNVISTTGSSYFFVNQSNGRVGIGTVNPYDDLYVNGTAQVDTYFSGSSIDILSAGLYATPTDLKLGSGTVLHLYGEISEYATNTTSELLGVDSALVNWGNESVSGMTEWEGFLANYGRGTVSFAATFYSNILSNGAYVSEDGGAITNAYNFYGYSEASYNSTITNNYGLYIDSPSVSNDGDITNNYGIYLADQDKASATNYAIYSAGGNIYFADNVGINTTGPDAKLHVRGGACIDTDDACTDPGEGNLYAQGNIEAAGYINTTGTDICIEGGTCLSEAGTGDGDITDVLAGWGINVTNPDGPQPRVNLSSSSAGDGLDYSQGVLSVNQGEGVSITTDVLNFDCSEVTDASNDGIDCSNENLVVGAGNGLNANATSLEIDLYTGSGLISDGTGLSMNRSCSDGQVMKWLSSGSRWYCSNDSGLGSEADTLATVTARGNTTTQPVTIDSDSDELTNIANTLYVNGTTDRVGIGTASPSDELNINGSLRVDNATGSAMMFVNVTNKSISVGDYGKITSWLNPDSEESISLTSTQSVDIFGASDGYFNVYNPSGFVYYVRLSDGTTWVGGQLRVASEVGIGTANPGGNLNIYESSPSVNQILFNISTNAGERFTVDEDGDVRAAGYINSTTDVCVESGNCLSTVSAEESDTLATVTARGNTTTQPVTIDSDSDELTNIANTLYVNGTTDKVGIGTATPGYDLVVAKTGANAAIVVNRTDSASGYINAVSGYINIGSISNHPLRLATNSDAKVLIDTDGDVGIGTGATVLPSARLQVRGSGTGGLSLNVTNDLFVNDTSGRVGIGTTNPISALDILGSKYIKIGDETDALSGTPEGLHMDYQASDPDIGPAIRWTDGTLANTLGFYVSAGTWYQGNSGNTNFGVRANTGTGDLGSVVFQVESDTGNVGIGTTNPTEKLNVNGDVNISSNSDVTTTAGTGALYVVETSGTKGIGIDNDEIQSWGGALYLQYDGAQDFDVGNGDLFVETSSGYVGIGTTSPTAKLQVRGSATGGLSLNVTNDLFVNDTSGRVGIGITNPTAKLHVYEGTTGGTSLAVFRDNPYISTLEIKSTATNTVLIKSGTDDSLNFGTHNSDTPKVTILTGGNVGIGGDTTPDAKLEVLASSGPQLMLTNTDNVDYANFTVDSNGDLTIRASGGDVIIKLG